MLTEAQIALVRGSFAKVLPIRETAAELFYARLFEVAPEVKPLFKGDMKVQGAKLMAAIAMVVGSLDRLDAVIDQVRNLARRHVGYGVKAEHYAVVGAALLWTLQQGLGDGFTPEVRDAWGAAYGTLSSAMIAAT